MSGRNNHGKGVNGGLVGRSIGVGGRSNLPDKPEAVVPGSDVRDNAGVLRRNTGKDPVTSGSGVRATTGDLRGFNSIYEKRKHCVCSSERLPKSKVLYRFGCWFKPNYLQNVKLVIHREGKPLVYTQLERQYQDWIMKMHNTHDEEATSGEDDPILIIGSLDKKANGILRDAVRLHTVVRREGMTWKRGQKIKILRGACVGVHNNNVYATIDYFLIEGFEDEAGG